ncbi:hypothetical protein G6F56_008904 [Rhizopus delemar]|nr:hypothetical protein G6F56_008904 [Rhizopus delemar]
MTEARYELQRLQDKIYYRAMTELKRELSQMIIPALIESQSLPGFFANEMFSSLTMDDFLESMDGIYQTLRGYYLDPQVIEQAIAELLKWVGITAFNDLVMRRHFNSWRRAMQIQYNITRLEEWCEGRGMKQVMSQLEHLVQAIKLLLLEKGSEKDAQKIFDICWFLKPVQIQKLIQDYHMAEHEQPMGQDLLRAVASRVTTQADVLLEYSDECDYDQPEPYQVNMNPYIPDYLNTQRVQKLMAISQM